MKTFCLVLCLLLQSVFLAPYPQEASAAEGKPIKIAMILWRGETQAEKGLKDGLKSSGYSVEYVTYDAEQDKSKLADILRKEIEPNVSDYQYVYCFGTTAIKMSKGILGDRVPQFFNAVAAPVEAEIVTSMDAPGGNISGVTNKVPVALQLEKARKIVPFKKLGFLFNPRERNSVLFGEELKALSGKMGFEVVELNAAPEGNQLEQTLQDLADKKVEVDAVFLPTDSFLTSKAKLIGEKLSESKIPSIGALEDFIKNGVLVGVTSDYYELGKMAAEIVDQNQKGKKMGEIPIAAPKAIKFVINSKTCSLLGIQVPKDVLDAVQMVE